MHVIVNWSVLMRYYGKTVLFVQFYVTPLVTESVKIMRRKRERARHTGEKIYGQ